MDAETLDALRLTLREVFAGSSDPVEISRSLADLGWAEASAEDPASTTSALFEEQGRVLGRSRALVDVLLGALGPALPPTRATRAVALPHPAGLGGLVVGGLDAIDELVLLASDGQTNQLVVVSTSELTVIPIRGLDPELGLLGVRITQEAAVTRISAGPVWAAVVATGRRALASELVGVGQAALETATEHVRSRTQFGRPIGSFQSVRHRLAESHVDLVAARELVTQAWQTREAAEATAAKVAAGRAADQATRNAIQVSGAMGMTWEHSLHRYVRRAGVLDALLGDHRTLQAELGRTVASTGYRPCPVTI